MNRRVDTIVVGRTKRTVRVERRPLGAKPADGRRWSRGEVHEAATTAVQDALCPLGGALLAEDVARILRGRSDFPRTLWGEVL